MINYTIKYNAMPLSCDWNRQFSLMKEIIVLEFQNDSFVILPFWKKIKIEARDGHFCRIFLNEFVRTFCERVYCGVIPESDAYFSMKKRINI